MNGRNNIPKIVILLLGDFLLFWAALILNLYFRYYYNVPKPEWSLINLHFVPFSVIFIIWLITFGAFGLYELRFTKNSKRFFYRLLRAVATNVALAIIIFYLIIPFAEIEPRRNLFIIASLSAVLIAGWRYLFNVFIIRVRASRVIFFGAGKETVELADYLLKNPQLGQRPVAFISNDGGQSFTPAPLPLFQLENQDIAHIVRDMDADTIIVSREIKENKMLVKILFQVIPLGVAVIEFPSFHEMLTGKIPPSLIGEIWFLENLVGVRKKIYEFFKRLLDIVAAVLAGISALVLTPFIVLAIKIESPGPVFFVQKRVGRNGVIFHLLKFRSTHRTEAPEHEGWGKEEKGIYTKVGKFLRKSYLDELPQLINIFRGEMSFVGPRPERPEFVEKLKQDIPFYEMRLLMQPGITGWAQINMEDDAAAEDAPKKMQYDLYYIKNRSLTLDLLIILRTAFTVLQRQGR